MAALVAGCGAEGPEATDEAGTRAGAFGLVEFSADPLAPPAEGANAFRIELRTLEAGEPLAGAALRASAVMPSMGHEAPDEIQVSEVEPGLYDVKNVIFAMPGTWEVHYHAEKGAIADEATFTYEVR